MTHVRCRCDRLGRLQFGKPILIVVEREERFWAWDLQRWQSDLCERDVSTWPQSWKKGWLQNVYEGVPQPIKDLIEGAAGGGNMMPFRRREYDAAVDRKRRRFAPSSVVVKERGIALDRVVCLACMAGTR